MKRILATALLVLFMVQVGFGQSDLRIYTRPEPPPFDVLNRVDLQTHWHTKIRMRGPRDGLTSVQLIPWKENPQVLVQTHFGTVLLFDAETGDRIWENHVGEAYQHGERPAYNRHSIVATRHEMVYVLSRTTGLQRVYTFDRYSRQPIFGQSLRHTPSAGPVLAEYDPQQKNQTRLFLVQDRGINAYLLPDFALIDRVRQRFTEKDPKAAAEFSEREYQLEFDWGYLSPDMHLLQPPLWSTNQLAVVSADGRFMSLANYESKVRFEYEFRKDVAAPMAQHGEIAYIGSLDFNLYAFNLQTGRMLWRYLAEAPIYRQPAVNDNFVYVTSERHGLSCLFRGRGERTWFNSDAERFLAASPRYVYAADRFGQLLILDQQRGRTLARLPTRDYNVPVINELTDRIYLASHDGQILCLRHRDQRTPTTMKIDPLRKFTPELPPKAPEPKPMPQPAAAP